MAPIVGQVIVLFAEIKYSAMLEILINNKFSSLIIYYMTYGYMNGQAILMPKNILGKKINSIIKTYISYHKHIFFISRNYFFS